MVDVTVLLCRIEEQQCADDHKAEQGLAAPTNLTLEHVIPQSWEQYWPLDDSQDDPIGWRGRSHPLPVQSGLLSVFGQSD